MKVRNELWLGIGAGVFLLLGFLWVGFGDSVGSFLGGGAGSPSGSSSRTGGGAGEVSGQVEGSEVLSSRQAKKELEFEVLDKDPLMQSMADAFNLGEPRATWEALRKLGINLSLEQFEEYMALAKKNGWDLTSTEGNWDQLLRYWARQEPREALSWILKQGVEKDDEIVYRMLREGGKTTPSEMLALAVNLGLDKTERGDRMMNFLEVQVNPMAKATEVMEIEDPRERRRAMSRLARMWPESKVEDGLAWVMENQLEEPRGWGAVWSMAYGKLGGMEEDKQLQLLETYAEAPGYSALAVAVVDSLVQKDRQLGLDLAASLDTNTQSKAYHVALARWGQEDAVGAATWALNTRDPSVVTAAGRTLLSMAPGDEIAGNPTYRTLYAEWYRTNSNEALRWVERARIPDASKEALLSMVEGS